MMQMTYGDLCFKFRRIPRPLSKIKTWVYFTLHLTNQWVWSKYPDLLILFGGKQVQKLSTTNNRKLKSRILIEF